MLAHMLHESKNTALGKKEPAQRWQFAYSPLASLKCLQQMPEAQDHQRLSLHEQEKARRIMEDTGKLWI